MSNPGDLSRPDPQRLIASIPLAVVLIAPDLTVAGVNPAAEQLLGQGARRLLGRRLAEIAAFGEKRIMARLAEGDARLFARGSPVRLGPGPPRLLDVMLAPVTGHPGWQMVMLHEPIGVESLIGGSMPASFRTLMNSAS